MVEKLAGTITEQGGDDSVLDVMDINIDDSSLNWMINLDTVKGEYDINFKFNDSKVVEHIEIWPGIWLLVNNNQSIKSSDYNRGESNHLRLVLKEGMSKNAIIETVTSLLNNLSYSSRKGFIVPSDLPVSKYPALAVLAEFMYESVKKEDGNKVLIKPEDDSNLYVESYSWIWSMINLSLYTSMLKNLNTQDFETKILDSDSDILSTYKQLMQRLYNNLDPSIRCKLTKPGVSIIQNTYTGFDTEYKHVDSIYNELISVQLAVNTRTVLKIPKTSSYFVSKLDTLTNKVIPTKLVRGFNYNLFTMVVNDCILEVRRLKFQKYDAIINTLYKGFINMNKSNPKLFQLFVKDGYLHVALPRTPIEKFIYLNNNDAGYSFVNILEQSNDMVGKYLDADYLKVRFILNNLRKLYDCDEGFLKRIYTNTNIATVADDVVESSATCAKDANVNVKELEILEASPQDRKSLLNCADMKRYSRSKLRSLDVNLNRIRTTYVIAHLTNADLSMLNDFDSLKNSLDIVNKSFITLGKPIKIGNFNVHIRDTMLLAPGGKKGLGAMGELLGFGKIELEQHEIEAMDKLLLNDRDRFIRYAVTDAVITLLYANSMEDELFGSRVLGIPISLSSLSATYVKDEWDKNGYCGYQISPLHLIGDSGTTQTPQGLYKTKDVGRKISMFISNYRGGRNESYMYGINNDKKWIDYDLTSAYTTAMALLGNPDYKNAKNLTVEELYNLSDDDLIMNYIVFSTKFQFPKDTKYPSIPCYIDEATTIYPLKGEAILTGIEFLLAKNQGCVFNDVKDVFMIPFEKMVVVDGEPPKVVNHPFKTIINTLQAKRREFAKKTLGNLIWKEKGNSIYGNIVRGMSNKKKYDIKTGRTLRMEGGVLTNPIIASYITAFIRSVIGEGLHIVNLLGGSVVSVTTDGFICDIDNLEYKLLRSGERIPLLLKYRETRQELSSNSDAWEVKSFGMGIISWTTRGQFSLDGKISASTGFQSKGVRREDLDCMFRNTMGGEDRVIEFIQGSLRSAKDIYLHGGHVTKTYADRVFRLEYDNKRVLNLPIESSNLSNDYSNTLLDSSPANDVDVVKKLRFLSGVHRKTIYNKMSNSVGNSKYKSNLDLAIRNFVKGCIKDPPGYNLQNIGSYSDIIEFVKNYKQDYRISKASISNLKNRKLIVKDVPKTTESLAFVEYVKSKYPTFDDKLFFGGNILNK